MKEKSNRFLFVLPNDSLGGAEQVLKMVATYQAKNNRIFIYFLKKKSTQSWDDLLLSENVNVFYGFGKEYFGFLLLPFKLAFKKFDYAFTTHVLITGILGFMKSIRLLKLNFFIARESTMIFNRFTGLKLFLYKSMYFLGYKQIDLLICQTNYMLNDFKKNLPNVSSNIKIRSISNPVDLDQISKKEKEVIKIDDSPYIVSAGRLIEEKGFDILINSFGLIRKDYKKLKLIILGEGNQREFLESLIREKKLEDSVILKGYVTNVYPYFKKAKVCVVSSRVEGFPNVLLQMMSQNHRVVSTLCAGGIESINGVFTSDINDYKMLANSLRKALNDNSKNNKSLFDKELQRRSIGGFIKEIEKSLYEKNY